MIFNGLQGQKGEKMKKREFSDEEKREEAFLRAANALFSHWKISNEEEKKSCECETHTRLFDLLISDKYIIKGESIKGNEYREHIVPNSLIITHSYEMFNNGYLVRDVAKMIEKNLVIIRISKEEQKKLDVELKLKTKMPDGWEFGDNPFKRLDIAGIKYKLK